MCLQVLSVVQRTFKQTAELLFAGKSVTAYLLYVENMCLFIYHKTSHTVLVFKSMGMSALQIICPSEIPQMSRDFQSYVMF